MAGNPHAERRTMKIFTIDGEYVHLGAGVESFTLKGAGVTIPAILVGESGRGRELGVLPVQLLPEQHAEWQENDGRTRILYATIGKTKSGRPKLFATEEIGESDAAIAVFRTMIGFRGGNCHTGDRGEEYYTLGWNFEKSAGIAGVPIQDRYTPEDARQYSPALMYGICHEQTPTAGFDQHLGFLPFPGEILAKGVIAQGDAGRAGSGEQLIAVIPAEMVFRTGYSGRLYGGPSAHYYILRDGKVISATWDERALGDLF